MLARIFCAGLMGLLLTYARAFAADTAAPITKIESRTLPPRAVTQRIFAQLAHQMRFDPYLTHGKRPKLRLSDMQFWAVPRASYVPELCESNLVTVDFDPTGPARGADTKVSASGLEVDHVFHFLAEPASPVRETLDDRSRVKANRACRGLKPDNFFRAPSADTAVFGVNLFENVVREARGDAPLSFSCKYGSVPAEECRRDLAKLEFAKISGVSPCTDLVDDMECHIVDLSDIGQSIFVRSMNAGGTVTKVDIRDLVTTGDARLD